MGVVRNQGIQNTVISYSGALLGAVNAILLFPNFLSPDQVGLTSILINVSVIYYQVAALGTSYTAIKYYPHYKGEKGDDHGFPILLMLISLFGFGISTLLYYGFQHQIGGVFEDKSALFLDYFFFAVPLAFFSLYFNLFNSFSRSILQKCFSFIP